MRLHTMGCVISTTAFVCALSCRAFLVEQVSATQAHFQCGDLADDLSILLTWWRLVNRDAAHLLFHSVIDLVSHAVNYGFGPRLRAVWLERRVLLDPKFVDRETNRHYHDHESQEHIDPAAFISHKCSHRESFETTHALPARIFSFRLSIHRR